MTVLLATKLHQPPSPHKHVKRPGLTQRLNDGLRSGHQVFLISAPAGFGKTICVSEWVNTIKHLPVTWLSLDAADDDPGRFFIYLLAALQKINNNIGQGITRILHAGQLPPVEVIDTTLINDIQASDSEFLLILDDFHVIQDQFILEFLERLLTNLPRPLRLVFVTREDPPLPLAQLRGQNRLTEIRASDLRFNDHDTYRFLSNVMGLPLSQADISQLEDKTEGWIVGLQLAGLSIRDRRDPSSFVASLSGSHRNILSYLTEEVINQQTEEVRNFLLQTSILDKLNGKLCDAVTGRTDSQALLEKLLTANLFIVPLDDVGQWYRYHHLFADLLRDLQASNQENNSAKFHQYASHWYAKTNMISEAIHHALTAEDFSFAIELLEDHAMEMIMQGYAKTVNGWVQRLPTEWKVQGLKTNLAFVWMHLLRGTYVQASPYLLQLEEAFSDSRISEDDQRSIKAEWLVMKSLLLNMEGNFTESLKVVEDALQIAPIADNRVRSIVYFGLACVHQAMDHYDLVVDGYRKSIHFGQSAESWVSVMLSTSGLAQLAFERGQLHLAFEIALPVSKRMERSNLLPPISTVVFGMLGEIYFQWHQLERAWHCYQRALQLSILGGYNSGMIGCRIFFSRLFRAEGDLPSAAREIQQASELIQLDTPDYIRQESVAEQVKVFLAQNRFESAALALHDHGFSYQGQFTYPESISGANVSYSNSLLYNSSLSVLLYQARIQQDPSVLRPGIYLANHLITEALEHQSITSAIETLLLRAQMHSILEDYLATAADYERALKLAEPEGMIGIFIEQGQPVSEALRKLIAKKQLTSIDFVTRILDAFSEPRPISLNQQTSVSPKGDPSYILLVDPLTERELEVLHLMSEGLKYKEIAEGLVVSVNTVRYHVKAIYSKLNAKNRMQAIQAARQFRIL